MPDYDCHTCADRGYIGALLRRTTDPDCPDCTLSDDE